MSLILDKPETEQPDLSRRSFIQVVGGAGASLLLGSFVASGCSPAPAEAATTPGGKDSKAVAFVPNGYLKVEPNGMITITVCHSDMGQGVRTSLAMLIADEMDADWHKVQVVQALGGDADPGAVGTGGSSSIRSSYDALRKIGASARAMLIAAAAKQWNVDPAQCTAADGAVHHGSTSIPYGELTSLASTVPIPDNAAVKTKDPADFVLIGKPTNRVDNLAVATGKAMYGIDVKVDGMKYAVIARPPALGAQLQSFDAGDALKIPGVVDAFKVDNGVAVIATNTWAAIKGRDALKLNWDMGPNTSLNTAGLRRQLMAQVVDHPAMPSGAKIVKATYDLPFLAHATMEPMNAVASVTADKCEVWTGSQTPDGARDQVAQALGMPGDQVTVHVMLLGGGFGRRLLNDYAVEAALVSKQAKCPIKLLWTREDDMRHDHFRPMSYHSFQGAVSSEGVPVGFSHQTVLAQRSRGGDFGGANINYKIAGAVERNAGVQTPVPTSAWRSVENTWMNVTNECFIDELAHAAGADPFEFRMNLIGNPQLKNVMQMVAAKSGWGKPLPSGVGRGIACFSGYGSNIAHVVEASVQGDEVKLHHVYAVVDVGLAVNPRGVEAQVQGACSDGCATALRAAITIDKGAVVQGSWDDFNWMTMDATPPIDVTVLGTTGKPGGMGEVGYPSVAPAVANAVFAACGKRVRKFPIVVSELE